MSWIIQWLIASYSSNSLLSGLVWAYKLDNANDTSWNSRNLTATWGVSYGAWLVWNCAIFTPPNTTGKLNYVGSTGITSDFAFSTWFRTTSTGVINCPTQLVFWTTNQIDFIYDGANTRLALWTWAFASSITPAQAISSNTWYHMLLNCSSWTVEIFFNNVSKGTLANTATSGKTDWFYLGWQNSWYDQWYRDSTYFWNRSLTANERATLYNSWSWYEF